MGTHICLTCGFVTYPTKYKTEEEIKDYYRKDYRSVPEVNNLFTGERKLHYHHYFLNPLFEEWKKAGITKPVVGEIGSAMGMFLNWVRGHFPEADVNGTELTIGFRKVAFYEFGVHLKEDFDFSKKYDLIASFHVLEHQTDPDIKLKEYAKCLKDSGLFYLSVPVWFRDMHNTAMVGFDLEYYWHPDHINSWSEQHLEHIIEKAGLEIVYKNDEVYGNTYILKKSQKEVLPKVWDVNANKEFMDKAYRVWLSIDQNRGRDALDIYKNCPMAWISNYEYTRQAFDKNWPALEKYLNDCMEACPNSADAMLFAADIYSRYDKNEKAIELFEKALSKKPNSGTILMNLSNNWRAMALREKDKEKSHAYFKKSLDALSFVRETSMEMKNKAISWMYMDYAKLDMPEEVV